MADRPAPKREIEITPAMVEAGVGKLRQLIGDDRLTDLDSDVVVYVFSAMLDAHPFLDIRAESSRSAKQRIPIISRG